MKMIILKYLIIIVLLYVECYMCYSINKKRFALSDEDLVTDSNENATEILVPKTIPFQENPDENQATFWQTNAQQMVEQHLARTQNENIAKNVIFFIGDGMSLPTLTAARIYSGQLQNRSGEEMSLSFEEFPYTGLSKTYCIDKQVADSACSGTALFTGVKTNYNLIGVNGNVKLHDCVAAQNEENHLSSILDWAQKAGKATGFVTTAGVTSATPAAAYAHSASRNYECDADVLSLKLDPVICSDIAQQLVYNEPGKNLNVIFGGGRSNFLPTTTVPKGKRVDNKNLIEEWLDIKNGTGVYISNRKQLKSLKLDGVNHVLGLFAQGSLPFHLQTSPKYPSLAEMTESAINILNSINSENGYVLVVEGGRIDHGHHQARAHLALDETVQLSETVKQTVEMIDVLDTLVVVTSDHAHTMSIAGYNPRGGNILGVTTTTKHKKTRSYTVLSYANGPGFNSNSSLNHIKNSDILGPRFRYPSTIPASLETHGGDDVIVFARGPWSHLFTGAYEQNVIPHLIAYASCIGNGLTVCSNETKDPVNVVVDPSVVVVEK